MRVAADADDPHGNVAAETVNSVQLLRGTAVTMGLETSAKLRIIFLRQHELYELYDP